MSEPIISPWIVYAIDVATNFKAALDFSTILLVIAFLVFVIAFFVTTAVGDCDDIKLLQKVTKHKRKMCIALAVCVILEIITPTKQAMQTMVVLSFVTPDNIALVQDNIIDFVERVIKAIKAVK